MSQATGTRPGRVAHAEPHGDNPGRDPAVQRTSLHLVVNTAQPHPPVDPGYARHLVRRGASFVTISQRYYGTGRYAQALWLANRGQVSTPNRLAVGMAVVVPPLEEFEGTLVAPRSTATASQPPAKRDEQLQRTALPLSSGAANDAPRPRP